VSETDWFVHMAWMDNHSGGFHGTGHYGVMIVNGDTCEALYADFGKYHMMIKEKSKDGVRYKPHEGDGSNQDQREVAHELEKEFDMVRVSNTIKIELNGEGLFADKIAKHWFEWNEDYGSGLMHHRKCRGIGQLGPDHEWNDADLETDSQYAVPPYAVDGVLGWAAFKLKRGAYKRMKAYIEQCKARANQYWETTKRLYALNRPSLTFNRYGPFANNCMSFALWVYEVGSNPNHRLRGNLQDKGAFSESIDHPNRDIKKWMAKSHDSGYFYCRQFEGKPTMSTGEQQNPDASILRREQPNMV
jgi:hypothetical protein